MIQVLDPNKKGRAITRFTLNKDRLKGFDYKAENLTVSDLISHKIVDSLEKIQIPIVEYRHKSVLSLDDKITYDDEFSTSSSEGSCNSYVTFEIEFNNEDVERWRTKESTKSFEGICYKYPYSDDTYIKILKLNETYELNFPYYHFDAIKIDCQNLSVNQFLPSISMFEIEDGKWFEFISDEEFKKKFDEVINSLKNKI